MPIWRVTLSTELTPQEVVRRLQGLVRAPRQSALFEGSVTGDSFKISRVIKHNNVWLPVVRGKVMPRPNGTDVRLFIRLNLLAIVLLAWGACIIFIPYYFGSVLGASDLVAIIIASALVAVGFIPEVIKATRLLREQLEA